MPAFFVISTGYALLSSLYRFPEREENPKKVAD